MWRTLVAMTTEPIHTEPIPTVPLDRPFRAVLEEGPIEPGEIVTVLDQAIVDGRCVVRSAHGEGYWHVPAAARAIDMSAVVPAIFEPEPTIAFTFPPR